MPHVSRGYQQLVCHPCEIWIVGQSELCLLDGGELHEEQPWDISSDSLRAISYRYEVRPELYGDDVSHE